MQHLFLCFSFLVFASSASAQDTGSVSGTVIRLPGQMQLQLREGGRVTILANHPETIANLNRLSDGDYLIATATRDARAAFARVSSVDFVGLRRMLGVWNSQNVGPRSVIQFRSYEDAVSSGSLESKALHNMPRYFKYAVSPAQDGEWMLFMSDERATKMGLLALQGTQATLRFLNPETGDVQNTLNLKKVK